MAVLSEWLPKLQIRVPRLDRELLTPIDRIDIEAGEKPQRE
jgi:hypothetical protein